MLTIRLLYFSEDEGMIADLPQLDDGVYQGPRSTTTLRVYTLLLLSVVLTK